MKQTNVIEKCSLEPYNGMADVEINNYYSENFNIIARQFKYSNVSDEIKYEIPTYEYVFIACVKEENKEHMLNIFKEYNSEVECITTNIYSLYFTSEEDIDMNKFMDNIELISFELDSNLYVELNGDQLFNITKSHYVNDNVV